jgi:hypothetical protein
LNTTPKRRRQLPPAFFVCEKAAQSFRRARRTISLRPFAVRKVLRRTRRVVWSGRRKTLDIKAFGDSFPESLTLRGPQAENLFNEKA